MNTMQSESEVKSPKNIEKSEVKSPKNIKIIERGQVPKDSKTQEIKGAAGIKVLKRGFEEDVRVVQRSR